MIVTDLNDRERKKYAINADTLAKAATELAEALRAGDDEKAFLHLIMVSLSTAFIKELGDICANGLPVSVPDNAASDPATPSIKGEPTK